MPSSLDSRSALIGGEIVALEATALVIRKISFHIALNQFFLQGSDLLEQTSVTYVSLLEARLILLGQLIKKVPDYCPVIAKWLLRHCKRPFTCSVDHRRIISRRRSGL